MQRQLKFNRAMAKTLKVHVLYGDHKAIATVISRLVEHEFSFNYSGEYLYSSTPWDAFIDEYCQDIKAQLNPCVENWADSCLQFFLLGLQLEHNVLGLGLILCSHGSL